MLPYPIRRVSIMPTTKKQTEITYLSTSEICDLLRISRRTLEHYAKAGLVRPRKLGGKLFYAKEEILKTLEDSAEPKKPEA